MFQINQTPPMYDPNAVQHMRDELLYVKVEEILSTEAVDDALNLQEDETALVVINSVCGCAAGSARPGVALALQNEVIPTKMYSLFAGQERDAVEYFRNKYTPEIAPSSPSMFLFKGDKLVFDLPRFNIEGRTAEEISQILADAFNAHCNGNGPSISKEEYEKLVYAKTCGSKIPLNK